jgi:hypothetical protein
MGHFAMSGCGLIGVFLLFALPGATLLIFIIIIFFFRASPNFGMFAL